MLKISAQASVNALPKFLEAIRAIGHYTYCEYTDRGNKKHLTEISPKSEYCEPIPGMHVWFDGRPGKGTAISCILPFFWTPSCSLASVTKTRSMVIYGRRNGWNSDETFKIGKDSCLVITDPQIIKLWESLPSVREVTA